LDANPRFDAALIDGGKARGNLIKREREKERERERNEETKDGREREEGRQKRRMGERINRQIWQRPFQRA
jgi:hypothetical protein